MKRCLQCNFENDDKVFACLNCRHQEFESEALASTKRKSVSTKVISKHPYLEVETRGTYTLLKCRTHNEAMLVADELEASDILVILPDEEKMLEEFKANGFVTIQVSSKSYAVAKELQEVIECGHWQKRGMQPLSIWMILASIGLGVVFCPGLIFFFILNKGYDTKGYQRKANSFRIGFFIGVVFDIVLGFILAS